MRLDVVRVPAEQTLTDYLKSGWIGTIDEKSVEPTTISSFPAATATAKGDEWTFRMYDLTDSGILTTASDVLFTGGRDGYFQALDARTGALLWKSSYGAVQMLSGPITYEVEGRQYVATIGGNVLMAYALRSRESLEPVDQEQLPGKKVVLSLK